MHGASSCLAANEPLGNVLVTRVTKRKRSFARSSLRLLLSARTDPCSSAFYFSRNFSTHPGYRFLLWRSFSRCGESVKSYLDSEPWKLPSCGRKTEIVSMENVGTCSHWGRESADNLFFVCTSSIGILFVDLTIGISPFVHFSIRIFEYPNTIARVLELLAHIHCSNNPDIGRESKYENEIFTLPKRRECTTHLKYRITEVARYSIARTFVNTHLSM